mmetsp:Transcript_21038/g.48204  ORF Transcript_21038/g.48204 Transcript_21038/m.48204 type:complete len:370 (-) Transcript_21038:247-1356(-)
MKQAESHGGRRKIERAWSRWRGSTLAGYLFQGDDITFRSNFRMSRETFGKLINLLKGSSIDADVADVHALRQRGIRRAGKRGGQTTAYCRAMTNPPTIEFKVGACLYAMGQGGCLKISADVASVGRQTLRDYLVQFNEAIMQKIRPIYMPCTPFSVEERASVQANFASRRNMGGVTLACDGSHIPFHPLVKSTAIDYRNYKGWYSILSVAFVDSYYRFFDLDVGYPGRAGDNTVLRSNWLMEAIAHDKDKWLGPGGVILGDCGASDGDQFFLNPYHNAATPDACCSQTASTLSVVLLNLSSYLSLSSTRTCAPASDMCSRASASAAARATFICLCASSAAFAAFLDPSFSVMVMMSASMLESSPCHFSN